MQFRSFILRPFYFEERMISRTVARTCSRAVNLLYSHSLICQASTSFEVRTVSAASPANMTVSKHALACMSAAFKEAYSSIDTFFQS